MGEQEITNFKLGERESVAASDALPLAEEYALQSAGAAFHALADTMPQMVWSTLPDGSHDYYNARWYEFTGVPFGSTDGEGWAGMFHEDDQPGAWERWRHSLATGEPYEVEYRLRHRSGEYRWMIGRALPILNDDGEIQRWIGTCTDIEEQKRTALQNEILSQELSHRIKNIFAIISGLISLTARTSEAFAETAKELLGRISALGRAHEFVRPHSEKSRPFVKDATLLTLLATIFESYPAYSDGRLVITGSDVDIDSRAATPIALIFHELATNAMKYGALATENGRVALEVEQTDSEVEFSWTESGVKLDRDAGAEPGFGSRLIDMAIRQQLGGSFERQWNPDGLTLKMRVKRSRLHTV
ncbi:MAG: PAS domain-containing protein [Erythrobacter sp.]|uniref:sensor histidine kinase n=1 Tax=Erythrobacter sp. TaxID=1042 RepID=UPI001B2075BE|nr:PAS domain-containing protein [Erythrobacter sp.]MBO6768236.1 PAS domain-containing protein [Erythrobacter sp.]